MTLATHGRSIPRAIPSEQMMTETLFDESELRHLRSIAARCFALIELENSAISDEEPNPPASHNNCSNRERRCVESTLDVNTILRLAPSVSSCSLLFISSSKIANKTIGFCSAVHSTIFSVNSAGTTYLPAFVALESSLFASSLRFRKFASKCFGFTRPSRASFCGSCVNVAENNCRYPSDQRMRSYLGKHRKQCNITSTHHFPQMYRLSKEVPDETNVFFI